MRFKGVLLVTVAIFAAFIAGRLAAAPPQMVAAQTTSISHYKCYQTDVRLPKPATVVLTDQFGSQRMQLLGADLFCTPVRKQLIGARHLPVPAPADHLMCYRGEAPLLPQIRPFANQLQRGAVRISVPRYLCVPTWKGQVAT